MVELNSLDDRLIEEFRLISSRDRCEFLANFPRAGASLKQITEGGTLGMDRSTVSFYLKQYAFYIDKPQKQDSKHRKIMTLNSNGSYLQRAAQYMMVVAYEMRHLFDQEIDYLSLFPAGKDPRGMLRVMHELFVNRVDKQPDLYKKWGDRNTARIVNRLSTFGLVELKNGRGRAPTEICITEAGLYYFRNVLLPVLDYLGGNLQTEYTVRISNGAMWDSYLGMAKKGRSS